ARLGCDISRVAVPSADAAPWFGKIAARSPLPLVADTHFDYRSTLAAIREGAAKIRINPGNMSPDGLERVVAAAGERGIPIRIGGNSGSILHRDNHVERDRDRNTESAGAGDENAVTDVPSRLAGEALAWAKRIEGMGFRDVVISVKARDAWRTVRANRLLADSGFPLHLGVTAAGDSRSALLKSAAAVGSLLLDGIGDTIRFSFTGDAAGEIAAARDLLKSLNLRRDGVDVFSCPACGRARVDLAGLAAEVRDRLGHIRAPLAIAVMGCEVNGPGEARDADAGLASAGGVLHLFVQGNVIGKVPKDEAVDRLVEAVERLAAAWQAKQDAEARTSRTTS
ncbi:MAG: flavodoxin-dependent (E)-4-hydroxy-3-methylbut-2-enyl-diphosphate synthase, partial [Planctomycetaceae bacterium]|nr:flavodoxin-dependent (E)-4-hydroxy-3-methylbut-2-enyl-diphosphate synthase [Planctomycetaceae bacterium]